MKRPGEKPAVPAAAATGLPATLEPKALVDVYLHQSAAQNQLWTTYVIATFTGAAFALNAGQQGGVVLLAVGAVGFSAFTLGHIFLILAGLERMRLAARDIRRILKASPPPTGQERTLRNIANDPVETWSPITCHVVIDACVLLAFADRIRAAWPVQ